MENKLKDCEINKLDCILKCKNSKAFYRFPHEDQILRKWLDKLGLDDIPSSSSLLRICNNHFSDDMFEAGGRRLKLDAVPLFNIPCEQSIITSDKEINKPIQKPPNIIQSKPKVLHIFDKTTTNLNPPAPINDINKKAQAKAVDGNPGLTKNETCLPITTVIKKPVGNTTIKKTSQATRPVFPTVPLLGQKAEIITSRSSRCFLRCRDAKTTYQFPQDEGSRQVWVEQLGLTAMPQRSSTARICRNHFSPRMFTNRKCVRLTLCAIPDINLPGQTIFTSEEGEINGVYWPIGVPLRPKDDIITDLTELSPPKSLQQNNTNMSEYFRAILDPPFAIENNPEKPEILINPIENIKTAINQEHNKEGILHVFQPGVEKVVVPDNICESNGECILKCKNSERLYKFPNIEFQRKVWLERLGLTHCYFNTVICDKHFSEGMFSKTKKTLVKNAYPDINIPKSEQPRQKDPPKKLSNFRIVLQDHVCDVIELPEYICVLTVLKGHTEVGAAINGMKYIKHNIDVNIPRREREVQVKASDLISRANVGVLVDEAIEESDVEENIDCQQQDWANMFKSHMSKADMFECLTCGEISVGYDCKLKHSDVHNESSSLCFQCGRLFSSKLKLHIHETKKHLNQIRKALRCPKIHCKKAFHSKKQLHNHVEEHTRRLKHNCAKCKRVFTSALKLHSHQTTCRNTWSLKYRKRIK